MSSNNDTKTLSLCYNHFLHIFITAAENHPLISFFILNTLIYMIGFKEKSKSFCLCKIITCDTFSIYNST